MCLSTYHNSLRQQYFQMHTLLTETVSYPVVAIHPSHCSALRISIVDYLSGVYIYVCAWLIALRVTITLYVYEIMR